MLCVFRSSIAMVGDQVHAEESHSKSAARL
jgi:hypothetical protein